MYLSILAFSTFFGQASPNAILPDTARDSLCANPSDTLTAIELQETPYFVQDTSGESRAWLDSCYTAFRDLLVVANQKGWSGEFTYDALVKRYPALQEYPKFRPALFRLSGKAVYASYMENPGFTPTIGIVNDADAKLLEFFYATPKGESRAWATPITKKG